MDTAPKMICADFLAGVSFETGNEDTLMLALHRLLAYDTAEDSRTMPLTPQEAARKALIAYRQLSEIVKEHVGAAAAAAYISSYNRILDALTGCFSVDDAFKEAVSHLRHLDQSTDALSQQMESEGKILLVTAHAFIELYLSAEDKKKVVGFQL